MLMIDLCTTSGFACNEAASPVAVDGLRRTFRNLPDDYARWLRKANGGEGFVGENYLILWRAEEIEQFNREYEAAEYAPGLLLIGSSGGGEGYAFDTRNDPWSIVSVPFIGMEVKYAVRIGDTFTDFIKHLHNVPS